jgi:hypothetical protein
MRVVALDHCKFEVAIKRGRVDRLPSAVGHGGLRDVANAIIWKPTTWFRLDLDQI